jgi:multiple sugar transport system substrate-binding protein
MRFKVAALFARCQAPAWECSPASSRQLLPASPKAPTVGAYLLHPCSRSFPRPGKLELVGPEFPSGSLGTRVTGVQASPASISKACSLRIKPDFLFLAALLCCVVASPYAHAGQPVVRVWTHVGIYSNEYNALKASADRYNNSHKNYRIDIVASTYRNYDEQVNNEAVNGSLPCLLETDGPFLYALAWRGYLQPIGRLLPKALLDDMLPSILAQGRYDGRLYSIGQFDSGLALWGNRRLLVQAGVRIPTLDTPWTLDEFEQALDKLSRLPGANAAIDMGTYIHSGEFYPYAYAPVLQGFGGDLIERDSYRSAKGVLDGPQSVAAMTHFQQWFKKGWARAGTVLSEADGRRQIGLTRDYEVSFNDFTNGKVALAWLGHWQYRDYSAKLGRDLILLPLPDFGRGIKTGMGSWSWAMSSTCPDPRAAADFLIHLMSEQEMLSMTERNGAVPARRSVLAKSPLYGERGPLRLYARQLNAGLAVQRPNTPAYSSISKVFSNAVAAIIGGSDVQAELSRAVELIDSNIADNRGYPND